MSPFLAAESGWYVSTDLGETGPHAASVLSRMISTGELKLSDHVWHPEFDDWVPVRSLLNEKTWTATSSSRSPPPPASPTVSETEGYSFPGLATRTVQIVDLTYLLTLVAVALPLLLIYAALLRGGEGRLVVIVMTIPLIYLLYWIYIEIAGVTVQEAALSYAARLPSWPYAPPRLRQHVAIAEIQRASIVSYSRRMHVLTLDAAHSSHRILLDDFFMLDMLLWVLRARNPRILDGTASQPGDSA